jgi:hypothetical protein
MSGKRLEGKRLEGKRLEGKRLEGKRLEGNGAQPASNSGSILVCEESTKNGEWP